MTIEPARLTRPLPVVLLLHGRQMTPDTVLRISGLADRIGPAVLVVPAGWGRSWNAGDCCGAAYRAGVDDVGFLRTVMSDVLRTDPVERSAKAYAVGFSNGGRLAYMLACEMPGVFSGFVAVEAVPVERCTPPGPIDMTIVAQQSDPLLTIDAGRAKVIGGFTEPTVAATVARMESVDRCGRQATAMDVGRAVERTWRCASGSTVRYVWYPSGRHDWRPSTAGTPGATDVVLQMLHHGPLRSRAGD
jgi:polyhydroxybutyrate depolymerase